MSSQLKYHRQPRAKLSNDASLVARLRHWFDKGSQIKAENKKAAALEVRDFLHQRPAKINPSTWNQDNQAAFDKLNKTPRQIPRAVQVQARGGQRDECEDTSSFSDQSSYAASSLTSVQSRRNPLDVRDSRGKKGKHNRPEISSPQPTKSLVNLASGHADVQNPAKAYDAGSRKPVPTAATPKVPSPGLQGARKQGTHKKYAERLPERRPSRPVKQVATSKPRIVDAPSNHRSTKAVVRKAVPRRKPLMPRKADSQGREWDRETRFEDFMGKDESVPPMPSIPTRFESKHTDPSRLSRPFVEPMSYESESPTTDKKSGNRASYQSNSKAAISPNGSTAQTWLRYDRAHASPPIPEAQPSSPLRRRTSTHKQRGRPDSETIPEPLFPPRDIPPRSDRRNRATPVESHREAEKKKRVMKCQECRVQVHPSAAVSYNGTFFCIECANKHSSSKEKSQQPRHRKEEEMVVGKRKVGSNVKESNKDVGARKPVPSPLPTPSPFAAPYASSFDSQDTTLRNTPSPVPAPPPQRPKQQPRLRRRDIPPGYESLVAAATGHPQPSSPPPPPPAPKPNCPPEKTLSYYSKPLPSGAYPAYRPPPPPPPPTDSVTLRLQMARPHHVPVPASSIYPEDSPWPTPTARTDGDRDTVADLVGMYGQEEEEAGSEDRRRRRRTAIYTGGGDVSPLSEHGGRWEGEEGAVSPISAVGGGGGRGREESVYKPARWRR
ncbi:MAG: hypothetical protein L6R37_002118 [Teloschistes peruensis]|nr:MAG: hypothetical protein L6R37_002118 [Teloschistes peruensis]